MASQAIQNGSERLIAARFIGSSIHFISVIPPVPSLRGFLRKARHENSSGDGAVKDSFTNSLVCILNRLFFWKREACRQNSGPGVQKSLLEVICYNCVGGFYTRPMVSRKVREIVWAVTFPSFQIYLHYFFVLNSNQYLFISVYYSYSIVCSLYVHFLFTLSNVVCSMSMK